MPVARSEAERKRFAALYKSDEEGVLLHLPLHLFDVEAYDLVQTSVLKDWNEHMLRILSEAH